MRKIATLRTLGLLGLLVFLLPAQSRAGFVPVPVTGFTQDVVANGVGPALSSITADVDGAGWAYVAPDFNGAGIIPATALPANRLVYSAQTSGVVYQLAPYNGNNSLRLNSTSPGTLSFVTPQAASELYFLATSGSAPSPQTVTVTFTDASTQVFTGTAYTVPDWYNGGSYALRGISRVNTSNNDIEMVGDNPRLYEVKLSLSAANYGKQIASVTFTKSGTSGVLNVMAIAINAVGTCAAPAAQPTALLITPTPVSAALTFNPPLPAPDKYLIVRTPLGAALSTLPVNGTAYTPSTTLGNGTVVSVGSATTFTETGLSAGTLYRYTVFAFNDLCNSGPAYNTAAPLSTTVITPSNFADMPATGYTADVVADTAGPASGSISADVDGASYAFMAANFNPSGTTFPTSYLPTSRIVNSQTTAGLSFQLQPYTQNNSLRITANNNGTLNVTTPVAASDVYLLATSGSGATTANITITFTDATTQTTASAVTFPDWYGSTNIAIQGLGRVDVRTDGITNSSSDPKLFEIRVPVLPANYGKLVASVTVTKVGVTTGVINVMGLGASVISPCATPAAQPSGLILAAGSTNVNLSFTAAAPNATKYLILRTPGTSTPSLAPANGTVYTVGAALGNATIAGNQATANLSDLNLAPSTSYRYTVYAYNDFCLGGPFYNTASPLSDTVSTAGGKTYVWNGSQNFTYTNPLNWTPARITPDANDILLFNNGAVNPVYGVVTQTVRQIAVSGNTTVWMQCATPATLTLASDNSAATNELDVAAGSGLIFNGAMTANSALTLAFSGTGGTANVAGLLESYSLSGTFGGLNSFNFTNATATVAATGTLAIGGTNTGAAVSGNTATNLFVNGTLNYKYFNTATPAIPTATYGSNAVVTITGFTSLVMNTSVTATPTTAPGNIGQAIPNLTYDCRSQKVLHGWGGAGALNVTGTFTMASTGIGSLGFSTTQGYSHQVNNFVQTGGTLNLNTGVATSTPTFNVSGSFTQSAGTFTSTGNSTGANAPVLNFNGAAAQAVSFFNAAPAGPITYRISNPAGITLSGTGTLTSAFNLNTNGGVRVSTTAVSPLSTSLNLTYSASGSMLTYDAPGSLTATATVFPATGGPANLTINTGSSGNVLSLPFSRSIPGTLNMTSGDIDVAGNTLTLGTSATAAGTLAYTAGFIRTGTGGAFSRWFGTAGLPTAATDAGRFPLGYNGLNRTAFISFSTATALSSGGTISASHTNAAGFTNGLSVADGTYTIDTRTNSSWNFAASGAALSGTIGLQLTGAGLFVSSNPANLRVMKANAVAGAHVAGSGQTAQRSGLTLGDLSAAQHIGAAAADITGVYTAITTGNWSSGSTWDVGVAPGVANEAYINPGVTVTSNAATNTARALTVLPGGALNIAATNAVSLDSALVNNGTVNVTGGTMTIAGRTGLSGVQNNGGGTISIAAGTLTLGPAGGGGMPFNQNGILNISGGALNINGNFNTIAASQNIQSGGVITVDGNAGGVLASSVACGTAIVNLVNTGNAFSGGTFTIVDPHACGTTAANAMAFAYTNASSIAATGTHAFRMGDGLSTDAGGGAAINFLVNTSTANTGKFAFWDLVVNAGTGTNRYVQQGQTTLGVVHDLTINNGGEYRQTANTHNIYIGNNLTVNTGGTFTPLGIVNFANYATGSATAAAGTQMVSGGGIFRSTAVAAPTARFRSITVNNAGGGVTFNIGNVSYEGTLTFSLGRIFMGSDIMIQNSGAGVSGAAQATGWVVGKFQKAAAASTMNHVFPIGDAQYYTPVTITGTAATAGDVIASTTTGDHPSLSSSLINPSRSVNRYWTISYINGLTMNAAGGNVIPTWNAADLDPGATPASFAGARFNASAFAPTTVSGASATSITASITAAALDGDYVFGETCSPLVINTAPQSQTVCAGSPVTLSVGVGGTAGVVYQWQKNGTPITGANAPSYTIPATAVADAGNYTVVLSSQCGGVTPLTSAVAVLTVNAPPSIGTQPLSQAICEHAPVTFSVAAAGTGISYQWRYNGTAISGATAASYAIPAVAASDAGSYTVTVTGTSSCGSATSNAAVLTVNPLPLAITAASTTTFCPGGSVVLSAGTGYSYQWQQNGTPISGATSASYTATTSGAYTVVVSSTSGCSGTSNAITVVANTAPSSTVSPAGTAAYCTGGTVTLSGPTVAGITYQWNLNGSPITGATSASYAAGTVGSYTLTVSAGTGCSTLSAPTVVSVNSLPTATAAASGGTTICAGNAVTLNANTGAGLTYSWNLNGTPITPAASGVSYAAGVAGAYSVTVTNTVTGCQNTSSPVAISVSALPAATITATRPLTFCSGDSAVLNANTGTGLSYSWNLNASPLSPAVTAQSLSAKTSGSYTVTVTDGATGCSNTSAATTVTANPLPNVTVTAGGSLSICAGSSVSLSVPSITGQTYQWSQGGTPITGATTNTYSANTAGAYTVQAAITGTGCTATSATATVTVNPLPTATISAVGSTTACAGDTVWLNANTGSGLSYQWARNGSPVSGATSSSYPATVSGSYTVVVTNGTNCSTTSTQSNVTINPRPLSSISYTTPVTFCEGGAVVLTAISGTGVGYQWSNNAVQMPGSNGNFYIATTSGNYTVTVRNSFGCTETSPSILVVVNPLPQPVITRAGTLLSTGSYDSYQWYVNSLAIPGSTGQSHLVTQNGGYTVRVTDANGCTNYAPVIFFNSMGIPQSLSPEMIKVYPNPARDFVYVDAPVRVNLVLRDVAGRVVGQQMNGTRLALQELPEGVYQLVISDTQGRYIKTEKLIHTVH